MTTRSALGALGLLCLLVAFACARQPPLWEDRPRLTGDLVDSVLGLDPKAAFDRDLLPREIPVVPMKTHLRPCCAFGYDLAPELASIPIPGVVLQNITSVSSLGPHHYDSGVLITPGQEEVGSDERNGLVYTCRGGFIDTAHVRDNADWTMFLAPTIARTLETGREIALPDEGGVRTVEVEPVSTERIEAYGRRRIAVSMAEWLAFQLSVWHEIATWYGWSAMPLFPEKVSAFSPEDLYSNALGARLAGGVIAVRAAATDLTYDRTLGRWLRAALARLGAVDAKLGMQAADRVDGLWWDSHRRVPDEHLLLRRSIDASGWVQPWTIGKAGPGGREWEHQHCPDGASPAPLEIAAQLGELSFSAVASLRIRLDDSLRERIPAPGGVVSQADFPRLVEAIRAEARAEFGPAADRPDR